MTANDSLGHAALRAFFARGYISPDWLAAMTCGKVSAEEIHGVLAGEEPSEIAKREIEARTSGVKVKIGFWRHPNDGRFERPFKREPWRKDWTENMHPYTHDAPAASRHLSSWLVTSRTRRAELAEILRVSRPAIDAWCTGRNRPALELACALEAITGGRVEIRHWAEEEATRAATEAIRRLPGVPRRLRPGKKLERLRGAVEAAMVDDHSCYALQGWLGVLGLSQRQLADALGVRQQSISLWGRNRRKPSLEHARAMHDASWGLVPMAGWANWLTRGNRPWIKLVEEFESRFGGER